jgi:hypothetical protein
MYASQLHGFNHPRNKKCEQVMTFSLCNHYKFLLSSSLTYSGFITRNHWPF